MVILSNIELRLELLKNNCYLVEPFGPEAEFARKVIKNEGPVTSAESTLAELHENKRF
jgi:hypothetical protein